jgi:putative endopeptidase
MVRIDPLQRLSQHQNRRSHLKILYKSQRAKVTVLAPSDTIQPGNDFYTACNEKWLKETVLPPYLNTYSVSEELEEYLDPFLYEIAHDATKVRGDPMGTVMLSAISPNQKNNIDFLKGALLSLHNMQDTNQVGQQLGSMIRSGIKTFINIGVDVAFYAGKRRFFLIIEPGKLGLPDPQYYFKGLGTSTTLKNYRGFLEFITEKLNIGINLAEAEGLEVVLAPHLQKYKDAFEINFIGIADLKRKMSAVPWDEILKGMGLKEAVDAGLVGIISPQWLDIVNSLFQRLTVKGWAIFLGMYIAVHGARYLPAPFNQRYFETFQRGLEGQIEMIPRANLSLNILKDKMSKYMSYLFVKRFVDPKGKRLAKEFVDTIFAAAIKRLSQNEWMETSTRKHLIKKMRSMNRGIFYPEQMAAPKAIPDLKTDTFLQNIYLLNAAETDQMFQRLHKKVYIGNEWIEPVYDINAYYYQDINEIVVPVANFFWPFYDSERVGWSYGGIGCIIGHELIHAFDEEGKDIDAYGELKSMWTKGDLGKYKRLLGRIIRLFNTVKIGDIHLNGALTASENLADLGGMAMALDALEEALKKKKVGPFERLAELRDFFISYAVSWRTKSREKRELQDVYLDKHAPPKSRVNLIVSQFDAWYEAFQVVPGDKLYIRPEERIRIF